MIAGLDGLRGFAVLLVLLYHTHVLNAGWVGVPIFFVLSGFLITGILIREKEAPLSTFLKNFYGRRFLRIFPPYYAFLMVLAFAKPCVHAMSGVTGDLPWALSYTSDFYLATRFAHPSVVTSHLWSLSVEEQFYLVWPVVIYCLPARFLPALLWSIVVASPLLRFVIFGVWQRLGYGSPLPFWDLYVLPTSHLDAFAIGALCWIRPPRLAPRALLGACASFFALCLVLRHRYKDGILPITLPHAYAYAWGYSVIDALSAGLLLLVSQGKDVIALFRGWPLTRLGRISYGVYLVHYPLTLVSDPVAARLFPVAVRPASFVIDLALSVALASASFHWLERPLLELKDRWFPRMDRSLASQSMVRGTAPRALRESA